MSKGVNESRTISGVILSKLQYVVMELSVLMVIFVVVLDLFLILSIS